MPITGPSSYLPTTDLFLSHWAQVDAALGAGNELVMPDGAGRGDLSDFRTQLVTARDTVTDAGIERALARATLDALLASLQGRLVEFNERVRADLPKSPLARVLPQAFSPGESEGKVREALRQMRLLWSKINAIATPPPGVTLPYTLLGGYVLATLNTDITAMRDAFLALTDADQSLRLARETRNDLQDAIQPILKDYRAKVPTKFTAGNALIDSLPALSPAPGRTPAPVVAHGVWDATSEQAKITWPASSDADLEKFEIRGVAGDSYATDDESVLGTVLPGAPREFLSGFALGTPGATAGFKVYVVLTTGNEKGSEAVYVTRPW